MKLREKASWLAVALFACAATSLAQDQPQAPDQPISTSPTQSTAPSMGGGYTEPPAAAARGVSPAYEPQLYDRSQVSPDSNTLAGAAYLGLGSLRHAHNVTDASISISQLGQDYRGTSGQSNFNGVTLVGGGLHFDRYWSRYQFSTVYNGGESFNYGITKVDYPFHNLSLIQRIEWARWHLILRDDFAASSYAAFTGAGMGGPGLVAQYSSVVASSLSNFSQSFVPSETIETGNATRYMNSVLGQAEYSLSRRSTVTLSASYGLLDFNDARYISSHVVNAQAGFDYQFDPQNSIAFLGGYGKTDYTGTTSSISDILGALAYGRKITGRLAFQANTGPQFIRSMGGTGNFQQWLMSVNSALTYAWRRSSASFVFVRGLTSGSGVVMGSTSDTFSVSASRQFTRNWTGSVTGGYAFNKSLAPAGGATEHFTDWLFGTSLNRQVGRRAQLGFNYGLWEPTFSGTCPVPGCGANGLQQTFGMTVNWHLHPTE